MQNRHLTRFTSIWQRFCRLVVKIFYRKFEVAGVENIPWDKGIVLCANHVNALADPVIVQAATTLAIRPLARSGLFEKPLLGWWLKKLGAVPIFRPGDKGGDIRKNKDSFSRCYELLGEGETLIIFPEGQSHSDSQLHRLKSGAARLTMGAVEANDEAPAVIPVGLNFSRKGKFRGDVLVNFGPAIGLEMPEEFTPRQTVREVNKRITEGLKAVTINADSWADVDLVRRLEKFFALRRGKIRRSSLSQRFTALQRLIDGQQLLLEHEPELVRTVVHKLRAYERLCRRFGVKDYHLTLNYGPWFILLHSARMILTFLIGLPLLLFAVINGGVPYALTGYLSKRLAKGEDQYDTSMILLGGLFFSVFWGVQLLLVYQWFDLKGAAIYATLLLLSSILAVQMRGRYGQILEDIRVFFMLLRKNELKAYLLEKRRELEVNLASLVRVAKKLASSKQ